MQAVNPYLSFDGTTLEAFTFYKSVFGGDFEMVLTFRDMGGGPPGTPESELDRIAHIALPIVGGCMLMASDTLPSMGHRLTAGNNFSISIAPENGAEADRLFNGLSAGGQVDMPLQQTAWAEKFATFTDRFGIPWMISYAGKVQFSGPSN